MNEVERLKKYCVNELRRAIQHDETFEQRLLSCTFTLGGVMYAQEAELVKYEDIKNWWDTIREGFFEGKEVTYDEIK